MKKYSNHEIIEGIKNNNTKIITYVYTEIAPKIKNMIIRIGGNNSIAEDLIQDALEDIYYKILKKDFYLTCKFSSYLHQICKNQWFQELKRNKAFINNPEKIINEVHEEISISNPYHEKENEIYKKHFEQLSKDCQKILEMHFNNKSIDVIKSEMGYTDNHYTTDRKYRCKESLKRRILNDPNFKKISNER